MWKSACPCHSNRMVLNEAMLARGVAAHCAIAVYAALGLRLARSPQLFHWGVFTAVLICASTVLTHQHYLADVASGAVLAILAAIATQRGAS